MTERKREWSIRTWQADIDSEIAEMRRRFRRIGPDDPELKGLRILTRRIQKDNRIRNGHYNTKDGKEVKNMTERKPAKTEGTANPPQNIGETIEATQQIVSPGQGGESTTKDVATAASVQTENQPPKENRVIFPSGGFPVITQQMRDAWKAKGMTIPL